MKNLLCILIAPLVILVFACSNVPAADNNMKNTTTTGGEEKNVPYMISSNHFVKNTYKGQTNPSYLLIRSYHTFESLFGVASVMGMDKSKLITEDNMKNGFVLSVIYQGNNIHEFDIERITLKGSQLQVYYSSKVTQPNATWTCNCHVTVLVENCKFDSLMLYENGKPLPDAVIKELQ